VKKCQGVIAAAAQCNRAVLVAPLGDDVHRAGCREVAQVGEVGALVDFNPIDGFRNEPMHIGIALPMRVAHHVYRDAIDENREVRAVIRVEAAKHNLVGFAPAVMLADN
jgi:hypothetical protein